MSQEKKSRPHAITAALPGTHTERLFPETHNLCTDPQVLYVLTIQSLVEGMVGTKNEEDQCASAITGMCHSQAIPHCPEGMACIGNAREAAGRCILCWLKDIPMVLAAHRDGSVSSQLLNILSVRFAIDTEGGISSSFVTHDPFFNYMYPDATLFFQDLEWHENSERDQWMINIGHKLWYVPTAKAKLASLEAYRRQHVSAAISASLPMTPLPLEPFHSLTMRVFLLKNGLSTNMDSELIRECAPFIRTVLDVAISTLRLRFKCAKQCFKTFTGFLKSEKFHLPAVLSDQQRIEQFGLFLEDVLVMDGFQKESSTAFFESFGALRSSISLLFIGQKAHFRTAESLSLSFRQGKLPVSNAVASAESIRKLAMAWKIKQQKNASTMSFVFSRVIPGVRERIKDMLSTYTRSMPTMPIHELRDSEPATLPDYIHTMLMSPDAKAAAAIKCTRIHSIYNCITSLDESVYKHISAQRVLSFTSACICVMDALMMQVIMLENGCAPNALPPIEHMTIPHSELNYAIITELSAYEIGIMNIIAVFQNSLPSITSTASTTGTGRKKNSPLSDSTSTCFMGLFVMSILLGSTHPVPGVRRLSLPEPKDRHLILSLSPRTLLLYLHTHAMNCKLRRNNQTISLLIKYGISKIIMCGPRHIRSLIAGDVFSDVSPDTMDAFTCIASKCQSVFLAYMNVVHSATQETRFPAMRHLEKMISRLLKLVVSRFPTGTDVFTITQKYTPIDHLLMMRHDLNPSQRSGNKTADGEAPKRRKPRRKRNVEEVSVSDNEEEASQCGDDEKKAEPEEERLYRLQQEQRSANEPKTSEEKMLKSISEYRLGDSEAESDYDYDVNASRQKTITGTFKSRTLVNFASTIATPTASLPILYALGVSEETIRILEANKDEIGPCTDTEKVRAICAQIKNLADRAIIFQCITAMATHRRPITQFSPAQRSTAPGSDRKISPIPGTRSMNFCPRCSNIHFTYTGTGKNRDVQILSPEHALYGCDPVLLCCMCNTPLRTASLNGYCAQGQLPYSTRRSSKSKTGGSSQSSLPIRMTRAGEFIAIRNGVKTDTRTTISTCPLCPNGVHVSSTSCTGVMHLDGRCKKRATTAAALPCIFSDTSHHSASPGTSGTMYHMQGVTLDNDKNITGVQLLYACPRHVAPIPHNTTLPHTREYWKSKLSTNMQRVTHVSFSKK